MQSIEIFEKIKLIRLDLGLSRPDFSKSLGISQRTIEGIENGGRLPRGDVLTAIAREWPRYAYWLLTDKTDPPLHVSPLQDEGQAPLWRVFDRISVSGRDQMALACPVKADWMAQVHFLLCKEKLWDHVALIELKPQNSTSLIPAVIFDPGLNFLCGNAGKIQLKELAGFLVDIGRADLIKTAEMGWISMDSRSALRETSQLAKTKAFTVDIGESEELRKAHINFTAWRLQGEAYEPKYSIDML